MPANALAAGASIWLHKVSKDYTMAVSYIDANASISAMVVELQSTDDGRSVADADANWIVINTMTFVAGQITDKQGMEHIADKPIQRIRFVPTTATGGAAIDLITARLITNDD